MSEPLDNGTLRHFLDFRTDGTGLIEIDEPVGFDAASFNIEQDADRYGRDISFAGGDTEFKFTSQQNKYGHQFEKLLEYDKNYGFESEVYYVLRDGLIDYIVGQVDYQTKQTDEIHEFSCAIIQSTEQALLKRRNDVKVNLFSDKDLDDNDIEPIQTINVLLKAKPIVGKSIWNSTVNYTDTVQLANADQSTIPFNSARSVVEYGVEDTLTPFPFAFLNPVPEDFKYITAQSTLTNLKLSFENLDFTLFLNTTFGITSSTQPLGGSCVLTLKLGIGQLFNNLRYSETIPIAELINDDAEIQSLDYINPLLEIDVPGMLSGESLWIYFEFFSSTLAFNEGTSVLTSKSLYTMKLTATSTFIDSVTKMVRLKDATEKLSESINGDYVVNQPRFDVGGEWYDNFVFSGNMIRGLDRFSIDWQTLAGGISELHSDYEVDGNNIFVGKYDDFYTNNEIGSFLIHPNAEFNTIFNERYTINQFNFNYKSYDQDKDNDNTIDGLHTETQWLLPNKLVENSKTVDVDFIRDPFLIESTRRKALSETNASVKEDDDVFIIDVVPLSPSARGGFTVALEHLWDGANNELKMVNDGSFNWELLGFVVGTTGFVISTNNNGGTYTVTAIERTLLTLELTSANSNPFTGNTITTVSYPFNDVFYTNRTDEGFNSIEGLIEGDNYSNLLYTPKRNILNNYGSYLATATTYKQQNIKNTYFKNWTDNETQVTTDFGGFVVDEIDDIEQSELSTPLVTPRTINTKVLCDFSQYLSYAELLKSQRGFVRVYDNNGKVLKGFVRNSIFLWAENSLSLELEEKFESQTTTITYESGAYIINEVGYPQDILPEINIVGTDGIYVQIFDTANRPLINKTRFENVSVNGVIYDNLVDLIDALQSLNG